MATSIPFLRALSVSRRFLSIVPTILLIVFFTLYEIVSPIATKSFLRSKNKSDNAMVSLKDLPDLVDDAILSKPKEDYQEAVNRRKNILALIEQAGMKINPSILQQLPTEEDLHELYGTLPNIIGLERCQEFRQKVPASDRYFGIAGQMNVGTNAAGKMLHDNLYMPKNPRGVLAQVPWHKHGWVALRNTFYFQKPNQHNNVLPVVLIRDPYFWLQSMCQSPYTFHWEHSKTACPNLVAPASIIWGRNHTRIWDSMAHVWNEWYREYYEADFPRLMVRFEDLLFRAPQVLDAIRICVGAEWKYDTFQFNTKPIKQAEYFTRIKTQSSWLSALIKNGQDQGRRTSFMSHSDELQAQTILDEDLMNIMGYRKPL